MPRESALPTWNAFSRRWQGDEQPLRALAQPVRQIVWIASLEGQVTYQSKRWSDFTGLPPLTVLPSAWARAVHVDDYPRAMARWERAMSSGRRQTLRFRLKGRDGVYHWFRARFVPLLEDDKAIRECVGLCEAVRRPKRARTEVQSRRESAAIERKRAVARLIAAENQYRRILDSLFAFVGLMTPDGTLIEANKAPLAAAGLEPKDVLGKPFWETYWWNHSPETQEQLRAAVVRASRGEASRYDVDVRMANGAMMTIDFMLTPLRDETGRIEFLIPSAVDISERGQTEQHLRESERRLKLAQQAAHVGTFEWNVRTGVNVWSPELVTMYGLAPGEFGGTQLAWEQLVHPEDREAAVGRVHRAFETGEPVEAEWRVAWRDGSIHWLVGRFQVLTDASGTPLSLVGVNIDITERKRAEAALRESEERFRTMANAIPQLAWVAKPDGYIDWYNQRWYDYTGTTPEAMEGWGWQSVHDPQQLPEVLKRWKRSIATGESFDMVFSLRGSDGVFRPFLTRGMPLKDDQGRVQQWFGTNTDISEQLSVEQSLQKHNRRLRLLWEAAGILLSTDDPDAMLQGLFAKIAPDLCVDVCFNFMTSEANDSLYLQFCAGVPPEVAAAIKTLALGQAVCGKVALKREPIVATCIQKSDQPEVQLVKELGVKAYACNPLLAGGRLLGTLSFGSRTRDRFEDDEVEFLETISHYVTVAYERMRLMSQLRETDRRKNEFLAMLAHELRNPLAPIRTAVEYMRLTGESDPDHAWARDMIDRQVSHLVHLIDDLLEISRITRGKIQLRKELTDLTRVLVDTIEVCRPSIDGKAHRLELYLATEEIPIFGDPVRLEQIFTNLLVNAVKYTDEGGMIRVSCSRDGGRGIVRVQDSGVGIAEEMLERIFEPFAQVDQSLDRSQGGLGIGLTLVKALAEMHEGTVRAYSRGPGTGSEFAVSLPLAMSPSLPSAKVHSTESPGAEASAGLGRD